MLEPMKGASQINSFSLLCPPSTRSFSSGVSVLSKSYETYGIRIWLSGPRKFHAFIAATSVGLHATSSCVPHTVVITGREIPASIHRLER